MEHKMIIATANHQRGEWLVEMMGLTCMMPDVYVVTVPEDIEGVAIDPGDQYVYDLGLPPTNQVTQQIMAQCGPDAHWHKVWEHPWVPAEEATCYTRQRDVHHGIRRGRPSKERDHGVQF